MLLGAMATAGSAQAAVFSVSAGDVAALINAINQANANGQSNTINLALNGTYTLRQSVDAFNGLPAITGPLVINGNGATLQRAAAAGTDEFRILEVQSGPLALSNATLRNGRSEAGGAILNSGTLNLTNSVLTANEAVPRDGVRGTGGAISNSGILTVLNSTVTLNSARLGGGIANSDFGSARVFNSILSGNTAAFGAGISNAFGSLVSVTNSLLARNVSERSGGGIDNFNATVRVTNSTLSANSAFSCGGLNNEDGTVSLVSSTLTGNTGGGLCSFQFASASVTNSLVVNSAPGRNCQSDDDLVSAGNNLDTDGSCARLRTGGGTFRQVTAAQLKLGALADNGGPARTHALLRGSVAIDRGSPADCGSRRTINDQRMSVRPVDGNTDGVAVCDIGAFEFGAPLARCGGKIVTQFGTQAAETLRGTPGRDVIHVFAGDDVVFGASGDDVICGVAGNDTLAGDAGNDQLLGGSEQDNLRGGVGIDRLDGGLGQDICEGGLPPQGDTAINCEQVRNVP
ncbi:MAG: hypothetical protein H0V34_00670 [Gammaproteobacteria bacterium]|nr:hypothetical protein [Gammaproteobacteria bacterium]